MNDSRSQQRNAISGRVAWIGGIAGVVALVVGGLWLTRKPIAEGIGQSYCRDAGISCQLRFSRLDFGGVTLRDLDIRGAGDQEPLVRAGELAIDLAWSFPLNFVTEKIGGDDVELRVDLRGDGGMLGDLDGAIQRQMQDRPASTAPAPEIAFHNVRIIGETEWGEVEALGRFVREADGDSDIEFDAPPVKLARDGGELNFNGARLVAQADGSNLFGTLRFDLDRMKSANGELSGAVLQVDFSQSGGSLTAHADGRLDVADLPGGRLSGAVLSGDLLADAFDFSSLTLASAASRIRELTFEGGAQSGAVEDAEMGDFTVAIDIDPTEEGGASGDVRIAAADIIHEAVRAQMIEIQGRVDVPGGDPGALGKTVRAAGTARLSDATLSDATSDRLASSIGRLIGGALPTFGRAAEDTVRKAGEQFDMVLPWSFLLQDGESDVSALSGTQLAAASGFSVALGGEAGAPAVTWLGGGDGGWRAQGVMTASGGGGPPLRVDLAEARGDDDGVAVRASGSLSGWSAGDEVLTANVKEAVYTNDAEGGAFTGGVSASVSGVLGGVRWSGLRTQAEVSSRWGVEGASATTAQSLRFDWDGAQVSGARVGAGSLTYAPEGGLAAGDGGVLRGAGRLSGFETDVSGANFTGQLRFGGGRVAWSRDNATVVEFKAAPAEVLLLTGEGGVPVSVGSLSGEARLGNGWRVRGRVDDVGARGRTAVVQEASARIDLSGGAARKMSGRVDDVSFVISDPRDVNTRVFENIRFAGDGVLGGGVADFTGRLTHVDRGVVLGDVTGRHSLDEGRGELSFGETPLIFRKNGFQPKHLSPVLRGAANVDGRVDLSGRAWWSGEGLDASAELDLRGVGFVIASAGVFEDVRGAIELSDALKMTSDPGQTLSIGKVTLGLPIEDGVIRFHMDGFDKVQLEDARWPFAGGAIRLDPATFQFGPVENRIVANAVDWNLAEIVQMFNVPDTQVQGIVSGSFPVVFSTGSARIDNAVLEASSDGGVIQYEGATTDAAAQTDENAKLLFDALKDFRYRVLKVGLDGDVAGTMMLTLDIEGMNPNVLAGAQFNLGIGIESELASLLQTPNLGRDAVVEAIGADIEVRN